MVGGATRRAAKVTNGKRSGTLQICIKCRDSFQTFSPKIVQVAVRALRIGDAAYRQIKEMAIR